MTGGEFGWSDYYSSKYERLPDLCEQNALSRWVQENSDPVPEPVRYEMEEHTHLCPTHPGEHEWKHVNLPECFEWDIYPYIYPCPDHDGHPVSETREVEG